MVQEFLTHAPDAYSDVLWTYFWFWLARGFVQVTTVVALCALPLGAVWFVLTRPKKGDEE